MAFPTRLCSKNTYKLLWHFKNRIDMPHAHDLQAAIAQLGERQTEDLEVPGSIPGLGMNVDASGHRRVYT